MKSTQRPIHQIITFLVTAGLSVSISAQNRNAPAPAPAPAVAPAPMVEQAPAAAAPMNPPPPSMPLANGQWTSATIDGVYRGACGRIQVRGDNEFISYRRELSISGAGRQFQNTDYFFRSADCSGSLYAAYQFPQRSAQLIGQRSTPLPENGQTVSAVLLLQSASVGQVQYVGAVIPAPGNPDTIGIAANGSLVATISLNQRQDEERWLIHASHEGLHMVSNREAGAANDGQGLPTRFVRPMVMARAR
jgi:hypothetical protein